MSHPPLPYWKTRLEFDWSVQRRQERCDIAIFVAYVVSLQRRSGLSVVLDCQWSHRLSLKRSASSDIKAVYVAFKLLKGLRNSVLECLKGE